MSIEGKALIAVGKAQGALLDATKKLLKEDPSDGLRFANWTAKHKAFFQELIDETESYGCADEDEIKANRAAGEQE